MNQPLSKFLQPKLQTDVSSHIDIPDGLSLWDDPDSNYEFSFCRKGDVKLLLDVTVWDHPQMDDLGTGDIFFGQHVEFRFHNMENPSGGLTDHAASFGTEEAATASINKVLEMVDNGESLETLIEEIEIARSANHTSIYWGGRMPEDYTSSMTHPHDLLTDEFLKLREVILDDDVTGDGNAMGMMYQLRYLVEEANSGRGVQFSDGEYGEIPPGKQYVLWRDSEHDPKLRTNKFSLFGRSLDEYPYPDSEKGTTQFLEIDKLLTPRGFSALETAASVPPGHHFDPDLIPIKSYKEPAATSDVDSATGPEEQDMSRTVQPPADHSVSTVSTPLYEHTMEQQLEATADGVTGDTESPEQSPSMTPDESPNPTM